MADWFSLYMLVYNALSSVILIPQPDLEETLRLRASKILPQTNVLFLFGL